MPTEAATRVLTRCVNAAVNTSDAMVAEGE